MLNEVMVTMGFTRSKSDTCLYVSQDKDTKKWCACAAFVDDIIVTGNDEAMIARMKSVFNQKFKGDGQWDETISSFLGMHITYDRQELTFSVQSKIDDLFAKFKYLDKLGKDADCPWCEAFNRDPPPSDAELDELDIKIKKDFASIVGSCIYFSITARPDIATIVNKACKGMHDPKKIHILYVRALMKYLRSHRETKLKYTRHGAADGVLRALSESQWELDVLTQSPCVAFSDANHLDRIVDNKMTSTSGNCYLLHGNLIQWGSKRQTIHASSSMQSELIAACTAADGAVWFHSLMSEFPFLFGIKGTVPPIPLLIDNQACLSVANHPENSQRTKHIALREFRIRDYVEAGQVRPLWCPGSHNLADHFTKLLGREMYHRLNSALGITGLDRTQGMGVLTLPAKVPKVEKGLCAEFYSLNNAPARWHINRSFDHGDSCAMYHTFCNSGGRTIALQFAG